MSLSCGCDSDWGPEPGDWYYTGYRSDDYEPLPFKRRKRCCSCKELIEVGALAVQHERVKVPEDDIEIKIHGEDGEIPLASDWTCETCSDLFFSLSEIGYCVNPRENMQLLIKEYTFRRLLSK